MKSGRGDASASTWPTSDSSDKGGVGGRRKKREITGPCAEVSSVYTATHQRWHQRKREKGKKKKTKKQKKVKYNE